MSHTLTRTQATGLPKMPCDRCCAHAQVVVVRAGLELHLCAHHYREHAAALASACWSIVVDRRAELVDA